MVKRKYLIPCFLLLATSSGHIPKHTKVCWNGDNRVWWQLGWQNEQVYAVKYTKQEQKGRKRGREGGEEGQNPWQSKVPSNLVRKGKINRYQAQIPYKLIAKENQFYKKKYTKHLRNSNNCPPESLEIKELLFNWTLLYLLTNIKYSEKTWSYHDIPKVHFTNVIH